MLTLAEASARCPSPTTDKHRKEVLMWGIMTAFIDALELEIIADGCREMGIGYYWTESYDYGIDSCIRDMQHRATRWDAL